jgi:hypothetical protein
MSGLRDPQRAVRGLAAGTLVLEAITLLLGIAPLKMLGGSLSGAGIAAIVSAAMVAIVLAGMMGRRWAWAAAGALQAGLILCGLLHWSIAAIGVMFGLAWLYVMHVRRTLSSPPPVLPEGEGLEPSDAR